MSLSLIDLITFLRDGGLLAAMLLFVFGIQRGWWVTDREYRRLRDERDTWKHLALTGTTLAGRAVELAEKRHLHVEHRTN